MNVDILLDNYSRDQMCVNLHCLYGLNNPFRNYKHSLSLSGLMFFKKDLQILLK